MKSTSPNSSGLEPVLKRFSDQAGPIRELALRDRDFRDLCDDLALALRTLARFEARPDGAQSAEIPEYRTLIRELEQEIAAALATGRRA